MHSSRTRTPGPKSTFGPRRDPGVRPPIYLQGTRILPCPPHLQGGLFPGVGLRNPPVSAKPVCHLATFGSAPPCERRETPPEGSGETRRPAKPRGPTSLPSPPPIRGWRGRRHACAVTASRRLQPGEDTVEGGDGWIRHPAGKFVSKREAVGQRTLEKCMAGTVWGLPWLAARTFLLLFLFFFCDGVSSSPG